MERPIIKITNINMAPIKFYLLLVVLMCMQVTFASAQDIKRGTLLTEQLTSSILRENRIGLDPKRKVKVYLPPGYEDSGKAYPVVYYFHNIFWSTE